MSRSAGRGERGEGQVCASLTKILDSTASASWSVHVLPLLAFSRQRSAYSDSAVGWSTTRTHSGSFAEDCWTWRRGFLWSIDSTIMHPCERDQQRVTKARLGAPS